MIFAKLVRMYVALIGLLATLSRAEVSTPHNALLDILNVHSNTTNEKLVQFFNDPKGLKSFMERADPKQIDQVLVFIDTIITESLREKEAILSCRDEKQAFVDRALKKRTTETKEHTKIKAKLVEAGEKVKDLEEKESDARTLVDTLKGRFDVAAIDVENCQDEVDKLTKQVKEETAIYNQIIDLLQECAGNTKTPERFEFIRGPKLSNGLAKKCSKPFKKLKDAEAACLAVSSCGWLHDSNCDSKDWRICEVSVKRSKGDGKACSFIKPSATNTTVENFKNGPEVDNNIYKQCKKKKYTRDGAKAACLADKSCEWVHDWGCDNKNWRVCTSSVKRLPGDRKGCSLVRKTPAAEKAPTPGKAKAPTPKKKTSPAEDSDFIEGPKVANNLHKKCKKKKYSRKGAKAACLADKSCGWVHDWGCDNKDWRVCSASLVKRSGDKKGCSLVRKTKNKPGNDGKSVVVPSPLKSAFQKKWGLDGWDSFSEVNTGYKIPIDGSIQRWEYVGGSKSGVYFQIYRFVSGTTYKLIGENFVKRSVKDKTIVVNVARKNRINVKKGDFIGWTFIGRPAFGFSSSQGVTNWATGNRVSYRTIGGTFNFPGRGKRLYQCRATVSPKENTVEPTSVVVPQPLKESFEVKWGLDGWQGFSLVNTGYKIPSAGVISKWEYVGGSSSGVYLQAYRLVSGNTYKLIGQNFIKSSVKGKTNKVNVQSKNRIAVKKGDFIGWTFVGKAAFGFSASRGKTNWASGNGVSYTAVGDTFNFPGTGKRLYQCRATVILGVVSPTKKTQSSLVVVPPPLKSSFEKNFGMDGWESFSEVNTGYKIPFDGSVSLWEYVGGSSDAVYLQVYRFVSATNYKLIGQNFVPKSVKGKINKVNIKSKSRITVKKGDLIGWTFAGKPAFGFSTSQGKTNWATGNRVSYTAVGGTFNFPGTGKRLYQCRATVSTSKTKPGNKKSTVVVPLPLQSSFIKKVIVDGWKGFSEVNTGYTIPFAGSITQWAYLGASKSAVYLQAYRFVSGTTYKLIGQNFVKKSTKDKNNRVNVRARNRIVVKKGDFIGWTFVGTAAFGFSWPHGTTNWAAGDGFAHTTVGGSFNFPGKGTRLYQVRATISK